MTAAGFFTLVGLELRLRLRRPGTLVALLAVVCLSWWMIPDPASGHTLLSLNHARVRYTSTTLALGSAMLAAMFFGLGGFYLLRGRIAEDLRSGAGGVIGACASGNLAFLASRWLAGVLYLVALLLAYMATIMLMQLLRGDGPIEVLVYLRVVLVVLLPMACWVAACATLFDSVAALMGKGGDVLYFILWMAQLSLLAAFDKLALGSTSALLLLDMSGQGAVMLTFKALLQRSQMALGIQPYNMALAALPMPALAWPAGLLALRCGAALLAMALLLPASALFHRFSPDRVKPAMARRRRSPLAWLNGVLRPLTRLVAPLWRLAPRLPGLAGPALGDLALTLVTTPLLLLLLPLAWGAAAWPGTAHLPALLAAAVAVWGVVVSDMSTRDGAAGSAALGAAAAGGASGRYLGQLLAALALGLLLMGPVALRFLATAPLRAAVLLSGLACLAALAQLFGALARTPRLFLGLFLFWLYLALNVRHVGTLDVVGFNGSATPHSLAWQSLLALAAMVAGWLHARRRV